MVPVRLASSVVQRQIRYVTPIPASAATGLVAQVYRQVEEEMRLVVPPALLHSPVPDLLAAYWMLMREPLLPAGVVDRGAKEAIAAAVSVATICPYCADLHSVSMYELCDEHDAEAVVGDRVAQVRDPQLREVATWARWAHDMDANVALPADLPAGALAELVGVVVSMHYLTRMVNVFLPNFLLPPRLGPRGRRRFKRGASWFMRPTLRDSRPAGRALGLLPEAPLRGAEWAAGSPVVAAAVGRAYAAFEAAGRRSLPPVVRELVVDRLNQWRGEEAGLSTAWCEELVAPLAAPERAAGRLALLTALASHQVDRETVADFRRFQPDDTALIDLTAWASFAAARVIGERQGAEQVPDTTRLASDRGEHHSDARSDSHADPARLHPPATAGPVV